MIVLTANITDPNFKKWSFVDNIVRGNLTKEMKIYQIMYGYSGLFPFVPQHFGMNRMYRNNEHYITYEFTKEQWAWFLLRWS